MRDYTKLRAWHSAQDLVVDIYRVTSTFPASERFGLTSQVRRAAISIASNIAEGCGRESDADLARFLSIATGSASECESQIITGGRLGFIDDEAVSPLIDRVDHVRRQIHNLRASVRS